VSRTSVSDDIAVTSEQVRKWAAEAQRVHPLTNWNRFMQIFRQMERDATKIVILKSMVKNLETARDNWIDYAKDLSTHVTKLKQALKKRPDTKRYRKPKH